MTLSYTFYILLSFVLLKGKIKFLFKIYIFKKCEYIREEHRFGVMICCFKLCPCLLFKKRYKIISHGMLPEVHFILKTDLNKQLLFHPVVFSEASRVPKKTSLPLPKTVNV